MKIFFFGLMLVALAINRVKADLKEDLQKLNKICMEQSKSTPQELSQFFDHGMQRNDATDAVKCHLMCLMEHNGHFKDGVLDGQHVMDKIAKIPALKEHYRDIAKAVADCEGHQGINNCDTAYKIMMCFSATEAGRMALNAY